MKKIVIDGYIGQWQFSKTYVREMLKGSSAEEVEVNVSSLGGDFSHALDIHDQFAAHKNVTVIYTGFNASSATILSLGSKKVKISENSFYLVHKPMGWVDVFDSLNEDDIDTLIASLEKKKNELAKFTLVLARMYKDKTGMPIKDILNLMKEETWLTADMAKEKGFVDEIIKPCASCDPTMLLSILLAASEITNDLNPDKPAKYHLHAKEFALQLEGIYEGVLFDPPYSLRQVKECYDKIGVKLFQEDTQRFPQNVKEIIAPKIKPGGIAITFGWNSQGFGKNLGFEMIEVLLVPHGRSHNDTIVTVELKNKQLNLL